MTESVWEREQRLKEMRAEEDAENARNNITPDGFIRGSKEEWDYYHSGKFDMDYTDDSQNHVM